MREYKYFRYFVFGIVIGFISYTVFTEEPCDSQRRIISRQPDVHKYQIKQQSPENVANASEVDEVKRIRILCFLNTHPKNHFTRAIHVQQTWGRHCDKLLFASTETDVILNAIGLNMSDAHGYVWGKEKMMLQYVYKHFINRYDWFYKADDDTFASMENLRFLLSAYSTEDPIYFGWKVNTQYHRWGYFQGGSGKSIISYLLNHSIHLLINHFVLSLDPNRLRGEQSSAANICRKDIDQYNNLSTTSER